MPIVVLTRDLALRLEHLTGLSLTTFRLEQHSNLNGGFNPASFIIGGIFEPAKDYLAGQTMK